MVWPSNTASCTDQPCDHPFRPAQADGCPPGGSRRSSAAWCMRPETRYVSRNDSWPPGGRNLATAVVRRFAVRGGRSECPSRSRRVGEGRWETRRPGHRASWADSGDCWACLESIWPTVLELSGHLRRLGEILGHGMKLPPPAPVNLSSSSGPGHPLCPFCDLWRSQCPLAGYSGSTDPSAGGGPPRPAG